MANKIRLGFIGANVKSTWASQSHFPALLAHPDVELTAVCTRNAESAEAARKAFGAKLAFTDVRAMAASPEIDAVAVVVRVPSHYEPTRAAIEAGKAAYRAESKAAARDCQRQTDAERAALAGPSAGDRDRSAVPDDDRPHDEEPEAGAFHA